MKVLINKEKGYLPSITIIDEDYKDLNTLNFTQGVYTEANKKWNSATMPECKMRKLYSHSNKMYPCIEVDLNIIPVVETKISELTKSPRYYLIWYVYNPDDPNQTKFENAISLKEYQDWNNTHSAKWDYINEKWYWLSKNAIKQIDDTIHQFYLDKNPNSVNKNTGTKEIDTFINYNDIVIEQIKTDLLK